MVFIVIQETKFRPFPGRLPMYPNTACNPNERTTLEACV